MLTDTTHEVKPRMLRSAVANVAAFFVAAAAAFVVSPIVVHRLGDTGYGVWVMLGSLIGYLGLLDLGIRSAVTHFIASLHAGRDHRDAGRLASTALSVFAVAGLLALLCAVILAVNVNSLFDLPAGFAAQARLVMLIGGLTVAVSLISNTYGGIIAGLQRFDALAGTEVAIELLRGIAIVSVLAIAPSLVAMGVVHLVASIARGLAFHIIARRQYPALALRFWGGGRQELRQLFGFGTHATLLSLAGLAVAYTQSIIVGVALSATMVTFYAIGANLASYARSTADAIAAALTPRVSALARIEGRAAVGPVVLDTSRLATLALLPIAITFWLRGTTFIDLWMGPSYGLASGAVLNALTVPIWAIAWRQAVMATLCGLNRHRRLVPYYLAEGAIIIALSLWLVHSSGIQGVAWAAALPSLAMSLLVLPLVMRDELELPVAAVWFQLVARPAVAMVPFTALTLLIERAAAPTSMLTFFIQVALALPAAALGVWLTGMRSREREYARARLRELWWFRRSRPEPSPVEPV